MNSYTRNESSQPTPPTNSAQQKQQQYNAPLILPATQQQPETNDRPNDIARPKRNRAKRSCDLCRKRKTRCNADVVQPCNTCQGAGVECQFLVEQKKRGPNASGYIGSLESRLKRLESLLQQAQSAERAEKPRENNAAPVEKHQQEESSQSVSNDEDDEIEEVDLNFSASGEPTAGHVCSTLASVDPSLELVEHMNQLQLSDYERTRYIGGSAGYHMIDQHFFRKNWRHRIRSNPSWVVQKVNDDDTEHVIIKAEELRSRPRTPLDHQVLRRFNFFQDIPHLTQELVDCMINAYFNHIHPHCPILNKVSFLEQYYFENPHHPDEYLLYAICAVATQFLSMEDDLVTGTTINRETVITIRHCLREKANRILEIVYKRSQISTVQTLILLSMFVSMSSDDDDDTVQWYITGTAIRMAQDLGLHRSSTRWLLPESEIELRRRIWYAVYIMDKWIAAELGRPVAILDEEFDVELPSVYEIKSAYHSETREAQLRNMKPALVLEAETSLREQRPVYAAFLHMISLARTLGQVLVSLYSPKMQYAARRNIYLVDTLNMQLTKWKMSIPPDLQCEDNMPDKAFPNGGLMHIFYNCVLLLLHRPFITDQNSPNINHALQSLSTCTAAAINIIDTVEALENMGVICMPWNMVGYSTFQAAIIFLFNARSENEFIQHQGCRNLLRCSNAYKRDECMRKSRVSKVLYQLSKRFSVPVETPEKADNSMTVDRPRKRDYEGDDGTASNRSSPGKQQRTSRGPTVGNTSEEASFLNSLPREMNVPNDSSPEYVSSSGVVTPGSTSTPQPVRTSPPPVSMPDEPILDAFYNPPPDTSQPSQPRKPVQHTPPVVHGCPSNGILCPLLDDNGPNELPRSSYNQPMQQQQQQNYDQPAQKQQPNYDQQEPSYDQPVHQDGPNTFQFVDNSGDISSILMELNQQPPSQQSHQQQAVDSFEQRPSDVLGHTSAAQFDLSSLTSEVPMWNLPAGVTWGEWDSLLNDSNRDQH
ncbi:fungal-specific transcription factor domain-containing protein [Fennellomyces sp. T-0311]|nr:fungal-specific transcription factor domain-containing protein [Fennellomyces sp. T-0311]